MSGAEAMEIFILGDMPHKVNNMLKKYVYSQWQITHLFASVNQISRDWLPWLGTAGEDDEFIEGQLGEAI